MDIIRQEYRFKHGKEVYEVLLSNVDFIDNVCKSSIRDGVNRFQIFEELCEKYSHMAS